VPRGGVRKGKGKWRNRSRTDRALPVGRVRLVPRGGVRGKEKKKIRSGTVCSTSLGFRSFLFVS